MIVTTFLQNLHLTSVFTPARCVANDQTVQRGRQVGTTVCLCTCLMACSILNSRSSIADFSLLRQYTYFLHSNYCVTASHRPSCNFILLDGGLLSVVSSSSDGLFSCEQDCRWRWREGHGQQQSVTRGCGVGGRQRQHHRTSTMEGGDHCNIARRRRQHQRRFSGRRQLQGCTQRVRDVLELGQR